MLPPPELAGSTITISYDDKAYALVDVEFIVEDYGTTGPFQLSLSTPEWRIPYQAEFHPTGLHYAPIDADAIVTTRRTTAPLREWINKHKPNLFLSGDRLLLPDDRLLEPRYDLEPFARDRLITPDWAAVDFHVESQGPERRPDSIQAYMSAQLQASTEFDVLLDDDGKGEAADLVGLQIHDTELHVTLVHCKYSSGQEAGARLKDLYEVCGQAIRSAKWRQHGALPLLRHLERRAKRYHERTGVSPFDTGNIAELYRIMAIAPQLRPRFRIIIAQPGLSKAAATQEHLRLLAGAASYVRAVTNGTFEVNCHS
jgi:hypothetical protein